MLCPRCAQPLAVLDLPTERAEVQIDGCRRCRGVFIDGAELEEVVPAIARAVETGAVRHQIHGERLTACPRCASAQTTVFHFQGIWVDHCRECRGVWLDGHEHQGLWDRVRSTVQQVRTYRDAPTPRPPIPLAKCFACQQQVPQRDTIFTGKGPLCTGCVRARLSASTSYRAVLCPACGGVHDADDYTLTVDCPEAGRYQP